MKYSFSNVSYWHIADAMISALFCGAFEIKPGDNTKVVVP